MVQLRFAALLGFVPLVFAATRTFDFTVNNARIAPDGFERE